MLRKVRAGTFIFIACDVLVSLPFHVAPLARTAVMAPDKRPYQPSLAWRLTSALEIGLTGFICRSFLLALNRTETRGLDRFLDILDTRTDEQGRTRGLITGKRVPSPSGLVTCRADRGVG